jgi:glycosyltransferase involved in cell wall biosynthesis
MSGQSEVAVIVPVSERHDDVRSLYTEYKDSLDKCGRTYEFIFVLDGNFPDVLEKLTGLQEQREPLKIIKLSKWFGEATALTVGFENSESDLILTLPAYYQVEPSEIRKVLDDLHTYDVVVARRYPRTDSLFNRIQTHTFHGIVRLITGSAFKDLGCGVRGFKRQVVAELPLYGDQHRFVPLLADRLGFRIKEVDVRQSSKEKSWRVYSFGIYPRRLLDLLTVFFLVKFTKKPLRFFGLIGTATFVAGALITLYLVVERLFFGGALADRPALLLSSLLVVLGIQIFALGLIGELIIFTHAKHIREYTIEEVINLPTAVLQPALRKAGRKKAVSSKNQ